MRRLCPRGCAILPFAALVVAFLPFASCKLAPPQAPSWETEINLPLINKRYAMQEIIALNEDFYADQNGTVHFSAEAELDSFHVSERLSLQGLSRAFAYELGRFEVPASTPLHAEFTLQQIFPAAASLAGQTAAVPPFSFSVALRPQQDFDSFVFVDSVTGTLTFNLRNGMPAPLGPLRVEFRDGGTDTAIIAFDHNAEIPPGGEMTRILDLEGKTFSNNIVPVVTGDSPGTRGRLVLIDPASTSELTLSTSVLQAEAARARLGPQKISGEGHIELGDSLQLVSALLKSGTISLDLSGNFPVRAEVTVVLPDFFSPANDTLRRTVVLSPNGNNILHLDLAGYRFRPQPAAFGQQRLRLLWRVRTLNTANEFITLESSTSIQARCASTKLVFAEVHGAFAAKLFELEPRAFQLQLPAGLDSLRLLEARLEISVRNGINYPVFTDLRIEGFPERGAKVQLFVRERLAPGHANGSPVETKIVLAGEAVQNFLNALPRTVRISGRVWVGERRYFGSVREGDAVATLLRFDTPLALVLPQQEVESEISALKIDAEARKRLTQNLLSGGVAVQLNNRLPFAATAAVHLAKEAANVYRRPDLIVGPVQVAAPPLDPQTGRALQPRRSEAILALHETHLKLFQNSPLYVGVLLRLPGSNGKVIRIAGDDYVEVQAVANIRVQVEEETLK